MKKIADYSEYDALSFAADESFQDWVWRGMGEAYWQQVMKAYPGKNTEIVDARKVLSSLKFKENWPPKELVEKSLAEALSKIEKKPQPAKVVPAFRWWAAASIIIIIGIGLGVYRLLDNHPASQPQETVATTDIKAPNANRAMITLADGRSVYLDSLNNGQVAMQGDVRVVKLENGKVAYESGSGEGSKTVAYNTLTNPRGSKVINIQLADGTHVWLNAESSVTYPVAFTGNERKVTMTGEAYFEVAHDASKPFYVKAGGMEVQVLGTHFNVNAYTDEPFVRTTLLQGSVRVTSLKEQNSSVIFPGQQAQLGNDGSIKLNNDVSTDEILAWKNEKFIFSSVDVKSIMRQLSRWYDVDVIYQGKVSKETFSGIVNRSSDLEQVLKIMKESGMKFQINGKVVTVME